MDVKDSSLFKVDVSETSLKISEFKDKDVKISLVRFSVLVISDVSSIVSGIIYPIPD
jgi:hypothetical protein